MAAETHPDLPLDEAYWQSLLDDVEARATTDPHAEYGHTRSLAGAMRQNAAGGSWEAAQRALSDEAVIDLNVVGYNRGGLLVDWNGLRGFLPSSHIVDLPAHLDEEARRAELSRRVGTCCRGKVIELDRERSRFLVSERAADPSNGRRDTLMSQLAAGQTRTGTITNVCSFGAFVDLGGVEGLLHISEISWGRVNHPADLLRPGSTVTVQIMSVDPVHDRVALSIKRLQPDPWATVEQRYTVGQVIEGMVTSVVNFGAFAKLEEGLEGLIHISELAEGSFLHPRNVVQEGQKVRACILNIDAAHRRLGLSLRQLDGSAAMMAASSQNGARDDGP